MEKIAIVIQRCHEKVVGGSENETWHYANLLKDYFEVHILTTTAVDLEKWANVLNEGDEFRNGICIKRFRVSQGRADYWVEIYRRLENEFNNKKINNPDSEVDERLIKWPIPLQEEFIRKQGPYSDDLMNFLVQESSSYKIVIFLAYLYPTTYFGMFNVTGNKIVFVPTLHDEAPAYLSAYKYMARRARIILWNTDAERKFGKKLWGELPCSVVGMGVEVNKFPSAKLDFPYLLYCGRIDVNKDCPQLVDYFLRYKKEYNSDLRLVFTGSDDINLPADSNIVYKGFVSNDEKLRLMSGANIFVMPSPNESFSIVTLEAMAQETPILASSKSEVIVDHVKKSSGGIFYDDYNSFKDGINFLLKNKQKSKDLGANGRKYVTGNYKYKKIREKLVNEIEKIS